MKLARITEEILPSHSSLNSDIWNRNKTLKRNIRKSLLQAARDFMKEHNIDLNIVDDIVITGSMANYNWTPYSDIDLHILINFENINPDVELVKDYYKIAKSLWNSIHDIQICGHEVEIYVQDIDEVHFATGIYSIKSSRWLKRPTSIEQVKPDKNQISNKYTAILSKIESIDMLIKQGKFKQAIRNAEKLRDKIKRMRQAGLETKGEYSVENLAFKELRNEGQLDRLHDLRQRAYDDYLSISQCS
jgi:predicted nucleotidyltransferase